MEGIKTILKKLQVLDKQLFTIGDSSFTIGTLFYLILALFLLFFLTERIRRLLSNRILKKYNVNIGIRQSISSIVKYLLLLIGLIVIFQSTGINLSTLGLIVGALGVGIGFGLSNIINNFFSGIIILFERPLKVGDRIAVGEVTGDIVKISSRATTVITNDNIAMIVPNSQLIDTSVTNWSYMDRNVRFNFPVRISYKEELDNIKELMLEVAEQNEGVLKQPKADVLFDSFENSCLILNLRVWTSVYSDKPNVLKSQLYYKMFKKFQEKGIDFPYPQRIVTISSNCPVYF